MTNNTITRYANFTKDYIKAQVIGTGIYVATRVLNGDTTAHIIGGNKVLQKSCTFGLCVGLADETLLLCGIENHYCLTHILVGMSIAEVIHTKIDPRLGWPSFIAATVLSYYAECYWRSNNDDALDSPTDTDHNPTPTLYTENTESANHPVEI